MNTLRTLMFGMRILPPHWEISFPQSVVMLALFLHYLILTKLCGRIVFASPRGLELQTKVKLILMVMAKAMHIISLALVI